MPEQKPASKAELAAAARAARKAAQEAAALRANLLRRKAQARATPAEPNQTTPKGTKTCP